MERLIKNDHLVRAILEAVPSPMFIVNEKIEIVDFNQAGAGFLKPETVVLLKRLCGEALHCFHHQTSHEECGKTEFCGDCMIRNSIEGTFNGKTAQRIKQKFKIKTDSTETERYLYVSASPLTLDNKPYAILIIEDITEIEQMRNLIPICSSCKSIRRDDSFWESVENYFSQYRGTQFSHSICPDCARKLYPELRIYEHKAAS